MILLIANIKGGVGKTTIATNLVALQAQKLAGQTKLEKHDVLLIDADKNGSSSSWAFFRSKNKSLPEVYYLHSCDEKIEGIIEQNSNKYQDIIIDAGGFDSTAIRYSLIYADKLVIPITPNQYDLWALEQFIELIKEAEKSRQSRKIKPLLIAILVNKKPSQSNSIALNDLKTYINETKIKTEIGILDNSIGLRSAFSRDISEGIAVHEAKRKNKTAVKEMTTVHNEIWEN